MVRYCLLNNAADTLSMDPRIISGTLFTSPKGFRQWFMAYEPGVAALPLPN